MIEALIMIAVGFAVLLWANYVKSQGHKRPPAVVEVSSGDAATSATDKQE